MKTKTKIIIIIILTLIAVGLIAGLFITQYYTPTAVNQNSENIFAKNIIDPDRIVYRNVDGKYYQFTKGTDAYNQIKETIQKSVSNYNESGNTLSEEEIDSIHQNLL